MEDFSSYIQINFNIFFKCDQHCCTSYTSPSRLLYFLSFCLISLFSIDTEICTSLSTVWLTISDPKVDGSSNHINKLEINYCTTLHRSLRAMLPQGVMPAPTSHPSNQLCASLSLSWMIVLRDRLGNMLPFWTSPIPAEFSASECCNANYHGRMRKGLDQ